MCRIDGCPGVDDGSDLRGRQIGECEIMIWRKGDHIAFACGRFRLQQARRKCWPALEMIRDGDLHIISPTHNHLAWVTRMQPARPSPRYSHLQIQMYFRTWD